jgi:hypothetical protein
MASPLIPPAIDTPTTHRHDWQPGPILAGHESPSFTGDLTWPTTVILVCRCGVVRRVAVPSVYQIRRGGAEEPERGSYQGYF